MWNVSGKEDGADVGFPSTLWTNLHHPFWIQQIGKGIVEGNLITLESASWPSLWFQRIKLLGT